MDERVHAPAVARNREPLREVLHTLLAPSSDVLEIASGTGEHGAFFVHHIPGLTWQPSDRDDNLFPSILAWAAFFHTDRVTQPLRLDVTHPLPWSASQYDAIFNANLLHISPWDACVGLLRGAGKHLSPSGQLILYGPYQLGDTPMEESNARFDATLRARDPRWGVRNLDAVATEAQHAGLVLDRCIPMPANNHTVVFVRDVTDLKEG